MVETEDDRLEMLEDFGVDAILHLNTQSTIVKGIFDNEWQSFDSEYELSSSSPAMLFRTTDISGVVQGDSVKIGNVVYVVRDTQPDGTGFTRVIFKK